MSYDVLKQTTTIFIHKTITFTRGPGPSLTTLGTPSPKRPRAIGWRDLNSNYYNIFYITAQYTLCPNSKTTTFYIILPHNILYGLIQTTPIFIILFSTHLAQSSLIQQSFYNISPPKKKKDPPLFLSSMVFHYRGTKKGQ